MKRIIPLFLTLALLLCLCACGGKDSKPESNPAPAAAPSAAPEAPVVLQESPASSEQLCGAAVRWRFEGDTLTLSGQGPTYDYELLNAPWDLEGISIKVKKLNVEEGITSLGANLVSACINLSDVSLPFTLEYIGELTFADCAALTAVNLPASLRSIADSAFVGSGLTALSLPQGLARIGSNAFGNCVALKEVSVPGSVVALGEDAFYGCDALASITVPEGSPAETLLRAIVPEEVLRLSAPVQDALVWAGKSGDMEWNIRGGVLTVGGGAELPDFSASGCGAAPWAPMSSVVTSAVISEGVERIGCYAFWNCLNLRSVSFPASLVEIGDSAFGACEKLASLSLPGGLRSIGNGAFAFCQSLTELDLPEGLESVGDDAFQMCTGMTRVTAPGSITSVGSGAFAFGSEEYPEYQAPAGSAAAAALADPYPTL